MNIQKLIKGAIDESTNFPVLFAPFFVTALLNGILATDMALAALNPTMSIVLRLGVLLAVTPVASGMTIFLDRFVHSGDYPSLFASFDRVKPLYLPLIGVNLVAWTAILLGFLLFIVPGIFLYVKFIFTDQEVLLGGETDLVSALENSWNRTTGRWGRLFQIILIFEIPLLFLSFALGGLPAGWGATLSVLLTTAFQTWLTLVVTHIYLQIGSGE